MLVAASKEPAPSYPSLAAVHKESAILYFAKAPCQIANSLEKCKTPVYVSHQHAIKSRIVSISGMDHATIAGADCCPLSVV